MIGKQNLALRSAPYGIHWFRRDLRIAGNRALAANLKRHPGRVLGLFCLDRGILERPDFSPRRFAFYLETLRALRDEMQERGGDLLVLELPPQDAFPFLVSALRKQGCPLPSLVTWNRDYEPYALARDARVEALLNHELGVPAETHRDHLLFEPNEIIKDDPKSPYYRVYGAYRKRWIEALLAPDGLDRIAERRSSPRLALAWKDILGKRLSGELLPRSRDVLEAMLSRERKQLCLPSAGADAARRALRKFKAHGLSSYATARDYPARNGTSHLSIYLKNGSLTVPEVIRELALRDHARKPSSSEFKFLSELVWREFYYSILAHYPFVETKAFDPKFRSIPWENDERHFQAWCEGRTGYPIVDAAMRQMSETGWMHNRARMIVASFLTKDLLIDWRWGERFFMQNLLDGDLASNNAGWQWAASTGTDPQPYFRIFNPESQSRKFDPAGDYIRKWVPELSHLGSREIHAPSGVRGYPKPIVDHRERSRRALQVFRETAQASKTAD